MRMQPPGNAANASTPCPTRSCSTIWPTWFKVFADTTRIKILFALMARPMPVGELAEAIGATQSAVSHQLRQLKQAHLVKFQRDGKSVIYSLSDDHVYTMLAQGMTHICE